MESSEDSVPAPDDGLDLDPRVAALRQRLNEALLEVDQGEYFRSRVHGWLAYRDDAQVQFPESLASRLTSPFTFERPEQPAETSTLDAFMLAYHAAETFCRQAIAFVDGSGPKGAPLIALAELKAGSPFNDRLTALVALPDRDLTEVLDFLFLPPELQATWSDDEEALTLQSVQEYLRLWFRALLRYTADWRNPYNAAKHGLAVGARPTHLSLFADDASVARPMTLMDGPTLTTVEHEPVRDSQGNVPNAVGSPRP